MTPNRRPSVPHDCPICGNHHDHFVSVPDVDVLARLIDEALEFTNDAAVIARAVADNYPCLLRERQP